MRTSLSELYGSGRGQTATVIIRLTAKGDIRYLFLTAIVRVHR